MKRTLTTVLSILMMMNSGTSVLNAMATQIEENAVVVESQDEVVIDQKDKTQEFSDENVKDNQVGEIPYHVISEEEKFYEEKIAETDRIKQHTETAELFENGECGENAFWKVENDTLTISGSGEMGPFYLNDILEEKIIKIVINDGITSIGSFSFLENLTDVQIPDSVKTIKDGAFMYCESLTNIVIPESVESIGAEAFRGCYNLLSVEIPGSVSYIGEGVFVWCRSLVEITVRENNLWYCTDESGALYNKDKTLLLSFPAANTSTKYVIADTVNKIGNGAFCENKTLTEIVMPKSLEVIGEYAFCDCSITGAKLPYGLKEIGKNAFSSCRYLPSIDLPETLEIIGEEAFMQTGLRSIYIPASVKSIGHYAFWNSLKLSKFSVSNGNLFYSSDDFGALFDKNKTVLICIPKKGYGNKANYKVPSTVTKIMDGAFWQGNGIESIEIPSSVNYIGEDAFTISQNLARIIVSDNNSVYSSDDNGVLFNKDKTVLIYYPMGSPLTSYNIPKTVKSIGEEAFSLIADINDVKLRILNIPVSVENIERYAFRWWGEEEDIVFTINYAGTEEQWNNINIRWGNDLLEVVNITFKEIYNTSKNDGYKQNDDRFGKGVSLYIYDKWTSKPLSGATVKIGDYEAVSGDDGIVNFPNINIRKKYIVECTAENYFQTTYIHAFYSSDAKNNSFGMTAYKNGTNRINVSSVFYGVGDTVYGDLTNGNAVTIAKTDSNTYFLKANVDWGEFQPGTIQLYAENSKKTLDFKNNKLSVKIGEEFDVGETFKLVFTSGDGKHKFSKKLVLKTQALPKNTKIDFPKLTSETIPGNFPFFGGSAKESFNFGMDFEKLFNSSNKVNVSMDDENVVITVDYGGEDIQSYYASIWGDKTVEGTIGVKFIIPVTDLQGGKWSGFITFKSGKNEKFDKKADYLEFVAVKKTYWIETPFGVLPVYLKLDLSSMVDAELGVTRENTLCYIDGNLSVGLKGTVSGGLGVAYNSVEITCGPYGKATAQIKMSDINLNLPTLKPHIELNFGVQLSAKAWFLNAGAEFEMGKWEWPKEDELMLQSETQQTELALFERDYEQNPNEFIGENNAELQDVSGGEFGGDYTVLTNVLPTVQGKVLYIDGKKILVFNNDNTERDIQNGLTLMSSEFVDGVWSQPTAVCDDGTMDSQIYADGRFVVWENSNKEFDKDENDWNAIMSCQEIAVSKYNGNKFEEQILLTDNNISDYAPVVSAFGNKAIVAWISNTESDIFGLNGETSIHYCYYDGTNWGKVVTVNDVGAVIRVEAQYNENGSKIIFANENGLNILETSENTIDNIYSDKFEYFVSSSDGVYLFLENGEVWLVDFNKNRGMIASDTNCISSPQFVENDGVSYLFWTQNSENGVSLYGIHDKDRNWKNDWSKVIKYCDGNFDVVSPSASPFSEGVTVCYVNRENINSFLSQDKVPEKFMCNLNLMDIVPQYGLSIEKVRYSENEIEYTIKNCGSQRIDGLKLNVLQNEVVYSDRIYPSIKAGDVYEGIIFVDNFDDGKTAVLNVEVMGVNDGERVEDSYEFNAVASDLKIITANVFKNQDGKYNIISEIANDGVISDSCVTVEVKQNDVNGKVLYSETYDNVLPKEKIILQCEVDNSVPQYYVCVYGESDNNSYNNFSVCYSMSSSVGDEIYGDITGDGVVNRSDLLRLAKYFAGWDVEINESGADVNSDGQLNRLDLLRLAKYFAGHSVNLG